jgi:vitamin B12 transporter
MIRRVAFFFLLSLFVPKLQAQVPDTVQIIDGVEILADKISVFSSGLKIEKIDSTTLSIRQGVSIATLLAEQSAVTVRSYSPGGIATLSLRGTNSSQSGVFWNGINLQQPNMGMTDLSRISTFDFSNVSLQSGGASALLGSGVIGGSLHLSNTMNFSSPLKASVLLSGGSAGKLGGAVKISAGNSRLAYTGSLSGDWNKNNFWYTTLSGDQERLEHALVKSASSIHQIDYLLNQKQKLTAAIWYQATDRQIPPTLTMTQSTQQQWDQAIRSSLQWTYSGEKQSFSIRSAFIDEKEHYQNSDALIDAFYHLNTLQAELEYKRSLGKSFSIGSGASADVIRADVPYYEGIEYQPEGSVWAALAFAHQKSRIKSVLNLRQDFSKGYQIPFSPSFSAEIPVFKTVSANLAISNNFRVPTMNDKYWVPGGNPELKPEESLNMEAGLEFNFKSGDLVQSKINIDYYNLLIDNLIQWVPVSSGIWTPQNVQKVWSHGIEISSKSDMKYAGFKGYFLLGYNYSPSVYKETTPDEIENLDNQLIYIPLHKVQETFYVTKNSWYAMFSYSLTGKRYVQSDNQKSLPSYSTLDLYGGNTFKTKKLSYRLQLELRNLFNTSYQSVLYYPEPGRSFSISLLITK